MFSNPDVIRRINKDFVPVALKAALVNNPGDDAEGMLYREIGRSKPAPQGICVANSSGKVLSWALMFDDDKSVLAFLDHTAKRYAKHPDGKTPVDAERFMRFPSDKMTDVEDNGVVLTVPDRHPPGKDCAATPRLRRGTIAARLYGRALDADGKPATDTTRQDQYVEDRFEFDVPGQELLARALAAAEGKRFRVPDVLTRLIASHAYLGQLDVNPLGSPGGGEGELKRCELWATPELGKEGEPVRLRIEGESEAAGGMVGTGGGDDGRIWSHEVKLTWQGVIEMKGERVSKVLLLGEGTEKLRWGNRQGKLPGPAVAHLPAGRPIDFTGSVRYGIIGTPVPLEQAGKADAPEPPNAARRLALEQFGPLFLVLRPDVQKELGLSEAQEQTIVRFSRVSTEEAFGLAQTLPSLGEAERQKALDAFRRRLHATLAERIKETLSADQQKRLRQLELQRDGLLALGQPALMAELKLSDEQRQNFLLHVQELQRRVQVVVKDATANQNPDAVGPAVMRLRKECEGKIEGMLTDEQKKRWKEMLGRAFEIRE